MLQNSGRWKVARSAVYSSRTVILDSTRIGLPGEKVERAVVAKSEVCEIFSRAGGIVHGRSTIAIDLRSNNVGDAVALPIRSQ